MPFRVYPFSDNFQSIPPHIHTPHTLQAVLAGRLARLISFKSTGLNAGDAKNKPKVPAAKVAGTPVPAEPKEDVVRCSVSNRTVCSRVVLSDPTPVLSNVCTPVLSKVPTLVLRNVPTPVLSIVNMSLGCHVFSLPLSS
jgi:hypothetical protein